MANLRLQTLLFIVSLMGFLSCQETTNHNSKSNLIDFPESLSLQAQEILPNELGVIEVNALDTLLFLSINGGEHFFHVYNSNLEFLGEIGKKGFGPNEFQAPILVQSIEHDGDDTFIWLNDKFRFTLTKVNLSQSLVKGKTIIDKQIEIEPDLALSQEVVFTDEKNIVGNMGIQALIPYRLRYYNLESGETKTTEDLPEILEPQRIKRGDYYTLFYSFIAVHPNRKRIVSALNYFNRMDIMDVDSSEPIKQITEGNGHSLFNAEKDIENGQLVNLHNYYFDISVTEEFILKL